MDKEKLKRQFSSLYEQIISSGDEQKMKILGSMLKRQMKWMIEYEPGLAEQSIEMLEAVNWDNYLSKSEAEDIIAGMDPKPDVPLQQLTVKVQQMGKPLDDFPCYNRWALLTTMMMILSDSEATLRDLLAETSGDAIFTAIYRLSIDKLRDKDKKYNIRKYFDV